MRQPVRRHRDILPTIVRSPWYCQLVKVKRPFGKLAFKVTLLASASPVLVTVKVYVTVDPGAGSVVEGVRGERERRAVAAEVDVAGEVAEDIEEREYPVLADDIRIDEVDHARGGVCVASVDRDIAGLLVALLSPVCADTSTLFSTAAVLVAAARKEDELKVPSDPSAEVEASVETSSTSSSLPSVEVASVIPGGRSVTESRPGPRHDAEEHEDRRAADIVGVFLSEGIGRRIARCPW